jgi:hypothetical protein
LASRDANGLETTATASAVENVQFVTVESTTISPWTAWNISAGPAMGRTIVSAPQAAAGSLVAAAVTGQTGGGIESATAAVASSGMGLAVNRENPWRDSQPWEWTAVVGAAIFFSVFDFKTGRHTRLKWSRRA